MFQIFVHAKNLDNADQDFFVSEKSNASTLLKSKQICGCAEAK
tara:strand:- start:8692 stop:8820 length:129 start_codon:yes stop_codon:yes gene_type:complete